MQEAIDPLGCSSDDGQSFPDLAPYRLPSTGLLSYLPLSVLPYAELARVDKPGFFVLWIVHLMGVLEAGIVARASPAKVISLAAFFLPPCWLLMSANFAWNDICDVKFDAMVVRSRHRPLVRGALSLQAALTFLCILTIALATFLILLPMVCTIFAIPMALGCFAYPLSKRWSNYPQLVLGIVLPSGVFMGAAAMGTLLLPCPSRFVTISNSENRLFPELKPIVPLITCYSGLAVWTVFFEVIYSFQDILWDDRAGVGTMTRFLKGHGKAKAFLLVLAIIQTVLHAQVGGLIQASSTFWPLSTALTFITLTFQILFVRLDNTESCMFWFALGNILTGSAMLVGYAGEYLNKISIQYCQCE